MVLYAVSDLFDNLYFVTTNNDYFSDRQLIWGQNNDLTSDRPKL